jgi:hypothetical protein
MKLPRSLNIHGHTYKIRFAKKGELPNGIEGICIFDDRVLLIERGLPVMRQLHVILHEIKHASQKESGLMQIIDHQAMELDAEAFASLVMANFKVTLK